MNKFIKDGKVAVLVSPGYGAGWYSWNTEIPECLFDPEIVQAVLAKAKEEELETLAKKKWPNGYWGGAGGLQVSWVSPGEKFRINEYDGYETLVEIYAEDYLVA